MTAGRSWDTGSLLDWGKKQLKKTGIEDFDVSAEILLRHVLDMRRPELLLNPRRTVDPDKIDKYIKLIYRRAERVPLQYLVGYVEFYNARIRCDPRALIPRPETEILVEVVIEVLKDFESPKILDIGTGSGNIAIALAKNIADTYIVGVDISADALDLARENAALNNVQEYTKFMAGDILDRKFIEGLDVFDCVVSNPPYVAEYEKERLQPEVIEHEPRTALFSPEDPLRFFKVISRRAPRILKPGGLMAFEVGLGQAETVKKIMFPLFMDLRSHNDLGGIERVVTGILKK
ncbi:MAG: peptide chain release factor N(5)-glutamine methyltransferase [Candidatus Zixiibacteriota bacterium]|nr:MAG: peptide chain release factor N(5)-glutamine methyltransferase [candidate division Zixibacteria bacterium]